VDRLHRHRQVIVRWVHAHRPAECTQGQYNGAVKDRTEPAEPTEDGGGSAGSDDEPSDELLARQAMLISERAAADVIAILSHADGLRRAVELAARSRDDPDTRSPG
jgi:hypothetical protein